MNYFFNQGAGFFDNFCARIGVIARKEGSIIVTKKPSGATKTTARSGVNAGLVVLALVALFMGLLTWRVLTQTDEISAQYDKINRSGNSFIENTTDQLAE